MKQLSVFLAGLMFSGGLIVSGMINPEKVLSFLDFFGNWDPSLAFVMGGAVLITFIGFRIVLKQHKPMFEAQFSLPSRSDVDVNLISGAVMFGVGWGLVGMCPGPAIAAFSSSPTQTAAFLASMLIGMYLARLIAVLRKSKPRYN